MSSPIHIHASCLEIDGCGVLLRGPSGSGKSSLVLQMLDAGEALFLGDDQIEIIADGQNLRARPAERLAGLLHIHGLGIDHRPHIKETHIKLIVELVPVAERDSILPLAEPSYVEIEGISLPCIRLCAYDMATPARLLRAAQMIPALGFPNENGLLA